MAMEKYLEDYLEAYLNEIKLVDTFIDHQWILHPLDKHLVNKWHAAKDKINHYVDLSIVEDSRRLRRKTPPHLQSYLLTASSAIKPRDFLLLASYFCRLLSADYTVVTEIKYHREPRQFLLNYLFPRSEKMFTYSYGCFAADWSMRSWRDREKTDRSIRSVEISGRKNKLCYFPLWKSVFICSDGFYSGVFLRFHDYWLRYRRGPGVLIGLLTYLTPLDINGSWRQRPLGIKVYKRAEEVFPDYAQEVNYYRAQEPVMEFRYFAPVNRLQVLIDNDNVTLADLLACCEKTSAWAEGV